MCAEGRKGKGRVLEGALSRGRWSLGSALWKENEAVTGRPHGLYEGAPGIRAPHLSTVFPSHLDKSLQGLLWAPAMAPRLVPDGRSRLACRLEVLLVGRSTMALCAAVLQNQLTGQPPE